MSSQQYRTVKQILHAQATQDGAGVSLKRALGQTDGQRMDPYLMMDVFFSDNPQDYLAGFPNHPHRGFETITYMLEGNMLHEDHAGNRGELKSGGIQWMTAGKGIIHSEMPQQLDGQMRGFQIWLNLPRAEKMKPASYQNFSAEQLPNISLLESGQIVLIAGTLTIDGETYTSPVQAHVTQPLIADIDLSPHGEIHIPIPAGMNALLFLFEGEIEIDDHTLLFDQTAILSDGDMVHLKADILGGRVMLLAGKPLHEPIVQYGPFVMNTIEEIQQAIDDYNSGQFP
ncbi:pirin family protein [Budvicia aquatica]|uniref:Pirin family protein n=1 Tax=Budvicia aquatica TaxID=82979 RepID=A0A2C6DK92_9GAMM|nr:pirin family protein [Budvicia aquatica]PHI29113.1 pirin family protein [Budvicia aquatica]VFS47279.1 Quercetin 2,3-dioxygenase [Budvicia aquatica]